MTSQLLDRPSTEFDTFTLTPDEKLVERYRGVAQSGVEAMREDALRTARYELDLPSDERRRKVAQRLRSWLALSSEEARPLVMAAKDAYRELELADRLELIDTEHDAAQHGLMFGEAQRIAELVPWLADVTVKLPTTREFAPAMSFIAASMAIEPV